MRQRDPLHIAGALLAGMLLLGGSAGAQGQIEEATLNYRLSETWVSQPPPTHLTFPWPIGHEAGGVGHDPVTGDILVTDRDAHSVRVYRPDGTFLRELGSRGIGPGRFNAPRDVDGLPDGGFAVSDTGNDRVQVIAADGTPRASWPVNAPQGIEVVRDWIYVVSRADRRIHAFDAAGAPQRTIDLASKASAPEGLSFRGDIPSGDPDYPNATFTVSDPVANVVLGARDNSNNLTTLLNTLPMARATLQWADESSQYWIAGLKDRGLAFAKANGEIAEELSFADGGDVELAADGALYAAVGVDGLVKVPDIQYVLQQDTDTFGRLLQPRYIDAAADLLVGDGAPRAQVWGLDGQPLEDIRFDDHDPELGLDELVPPGDLAATEAHGYVLWRSGKLRRIEGDALGPPWSAPVGTTRWLVGLGAYGDRVASFDLANQTILFFDPDLNEVDEWSVESAGFSGAVDIALTADRVILVDRYTYRLTIWTYDGTLIATREMAGRPERVAVGPQGRAFVLTRAGWVLAFDDAGEPMGAWSVSGPDDQPSDIAVDKDGRLYVSDLGGSIRVYDQDPDAPSGLPQLGGANQCGAIAFKSASPSVIEYGETVEVQLVVDGVCPSEDESVDVVLTVDSSGSMFGRKLLAAMQAGISFAMNVDGPRSRIGVTSFSNGAEEIQVLTEDRGQAIRSIASLQAGGSTNVVAGLSQAWQTMNKATVRPQSGRVIIFLSDGRHSIGAVPIRDLDNIIAGVRRDGIRVFTVGLGGDADRDTLRKMATDPSHFYYSPGEDELEGIYAQIAGRIDETPLFREIVVKDVVPENMDYVIGSGSPVEPDWDEASRTLSWNLGEVPEPGFRLTYELLPREGGLWPTNVEAHTEHTDGRDEEGELVFPVPYVRIVGAPTPTPSPTDTPTPTTTPTDTPTPTPTNDPTATPTPTFTPSPTATPTNTPTHTPTPTNTPTEEPRPIYLPVVVVDRCVAQTRISDIVLVIDSSSSMEVPTRVDGPKKLDAAIRAASEFVGGLNFPNEQVGVVQFNRDAIILTDLTDDPLEAWDALNRVEMTPGTKIDAGIEAAHAILRGTKRRQKAAPVVVLLTDGRPTWSTASEVIIAAERLKASGATLFTIGLGYDVDPDLLMLLATRPSFYYFAPGTDELSEVYKQIARQLPCEGWR